MADPYAERAADPAGEVPAGDPPWLDEIEPLFGGHPWLVVRDAGLLPPVFRAGGAAAAMLAAVSGADVPPDGSGTLVLKHGWIAGPPGRPGCIDVDADLLRPVVESIREVGWERDPDFGFEVPVEVPGMDPERSRVLCPRFVYADHDRVYEYADLVAETKRRWFEQLSIRDDLPEEVLEATGWPPEATGDRWRDRD